MNPDRFTCKTARLASSTPAFRRRAILAGGVLALAAGPARAVGRDAAPFMLPQAEEWSVESRAGRRYRVLVSWPEGPAPAAGFPAVYALDGNAFFEVMTAVMRWRPPGNQGIVVAIDFPLGETDPRRRDREFLPAGPRPTEGGGADALLDFIAGELRDRLAERFPLDPVRQMLFGHSYGGLFTLHALFTRTAAFQVYLAASPSIWWGDAVILRERDAFAAAAPTGPAPRLLMTYGELERRSRVLAAQRSPAPRAMRENVLEMAESLRAMPSRFSDITVQEFPGETHGTVRAPAAARSIDYGFPAGPPLPFR